MAKAAASPHVSSRQGHVGGRPKLAQRDLLLNHYIRFVLPRESGSLRERLLKALVERALKTSNPAHTITIDDLCRRIGRLTGLPSYPRESVEPILRLLLHEGRVEREVSRKGEQLYRLAVSRFAALDDALAASEGNDVILAAQICRAAQEAHGELSATDAELLADGFVQFTGRILSSFGHHCARTLLAEQKWDEVDSYKGFTEQLDKAVAGLPRELQVTARRVYREAIADPSPEMQSYLYSVGQAYYIVGLLNLDPELQSIQRLRLEETVVYLDTNLLVAALLPEHVSSDGAIALIRLCNSVGLKVRYSRRTGNELESLLDAADADYAAYPPIDLNAAARLAPLMDKDSISHSPVCLARRARSPRCHRGFGG
jgi:hypothetical protein